MLFCYPGPLFGFPTTELGFLAAIWFILVFSAVFPAMQAAFNFRRTSRFGSAPLAFVSSGAVMLLGFVGLAVFLLRSDNRRVVPFFVAIAAALLLMTVIGGFVGEVVAFLHRRLKKPSAGEQVDSRPLERGAVSAEDRMKGQGESSN